MDFKKVGLIEEVIGYPAKHNICFQSLAEKFNIMHSSGTFTYFGCNKNLASFIPFLSANLNTSFL